MEVLKHELREKIEKEGGVMHSFSPEERMSFSQLISFNHRGDPDLADVLPIDPQTTQLFDAVGNGILLCKMVNHAVPGTIDPKLINTKKPLNVFQIKENLSLAIKGSQQIGCVIVSITPPLIMEKREHIILGMIWQVMKATLGLQVNLKNQPNMIRLKHADEELAAFQKLPTEEMLLRWLNYHLRNAGSKKVAKNFSSDLKDANIYTTVLNQLEPQQCDLSGLNMSDAERANKVIEDTVKLQIPRFLRGDDILAGNPKLNLIFCGEIFNHYPGLVGIQPFGEADRMAFSILVSANHKDDEALKSKLPINPNSKDLLNASKDGQLLTKMMNRAVPGAVDEGKIQFGDNLEENQMIQNLENFLDVAKNQGLNMGFVKPTMIVDEVEDLVLATLWQVLKKDTDEKVNLDKNPNLIRLKKTEEDVEEYKKLRGSEHFLLRWINHHLQNAGTYKEVTNFTENLKDGMVYTVLLNQLDDVQCDKSGLEDPEEVRIAKVIDNAAKLGVPKFIRPSDVLQENDRLNLLFCSEIYYRQSGLREVEPFGDGDRVALAILLSERHKNDEHLQKFLPMNPQSKDLFTTTANSVLLSKMIQKADSNAIDMSQINTGESLENDQIYDNVNKSLASAKKIGCDLKNIGVPTILNQVPDLVLKCLTEILKADIRNHLNPTNYPLLSLLKKADEDLETFKKLNDPADYLLRWINYHLKNAGSDKEVKNFGSDLKDGVAYALLLNQLDPIQCDKSGLEKSEEERCQKAIDDASLLGVPKFIAPADILSENLNLNYLFCSEIFWRNQGLESKKEFCQEEKRCFARIINEKLKEDADVANVVPINPEGNALFESLKNGVILNKLVNDAVPGTIDPRAINTKEPLTSFHIKENLQLGLASAKAIGCKVDEIHPADIVKGKENEDLKTLSEVFKAKPHWNVNVKDHPYLLRLKKNEEEAADMLKLSAEDMLMRWINHHLKNAGNEQGIKNYGEDLADCKNFTLLLNQLDHEKIDKSGLDDDLNKRAEKVLENSKTLGVKPFMEVPDLLSANQTLNFLFAYDLFSNKPNLQLNEEEKYEAADLLKDDVGDSREERSFRMWVNSLKIPDVHVNNLFEDIKDGLVLLKVLDRVEPGCVEWKKVEHKPNHRVKKIHNSNYAVEIGKNMKFSLVNVGGIDLVDGKKKLALALIWQMVRKHTLQLLGGWTEEKLLQWALERVHKDPKITSFKDKTISNCHFLFNLLASIEPRAINWELVTPGSTPEEIENNCNYVLSVARKLGATIFLVWEDLKDVNHKMIMTLFAALVYIADHGKQEEMPDFTKNTTENI